MRHVVSGLRAMCRSYFGGGALSALDRAVHIALSVEAGVLACEEDAPERPGEPRAERGIVGRSEIPSPAARPRIARPGDVAMADELRIAGAEPVEIVREGFHAGRPDSLVRVEAGRSAGPERQDARTPALFLVAVPGGPP